MNAINLADAITELSSAMAIKVRTGHLSLPQRASAPAMFNRLVADSFTMVPVASRHFRIAAGVLDQHALDHRLAEAGPLVGTPTTLLA